MYTLKADPRITAMEASKSLMAANPSAPPAAPPSAATPAAPSTVVSPAAKPPTEGSTASRIAELEAQLAEVKKSSRIAELEAQVAEAKKAQAPVAAPVAAPAAAPVAAQASAPPPAAVSPAAAPPTPPGAAWPSTAGTQSSEGMRAAPPLQLVRSRAGDISVSAPSTWRITLDDYPARLILGIDTGAMDVTRMSEGDFSAMKVARLPLAALRRSANYDPRAADGTCNNWKDVATGSVTAESVALWISEATKKSAESQVGRKLDLQQSILDAEIVSASEIRWHVSIKNVAPVSQEPMLFGLGGNTTQYRDVGVSSRISTGKALLKNGIVTFITVDSPKRNYDPSFSGEQNGKWFDSIVATLQV